MADYTRLCLQLAELKHRSSIRPARTDETLNSYAFLFLRTSSTITESLRLRHLRTMASSFKRAGAPARPAPPQGTHLSVQNGQLLTSSGLTDFDDILSGGLVLGTITLIEEDLNTRHSLSLCKYLLAEGAVCGHALMVASASGNPRDLLRSLPAVISDEEHRNIIQAEKPETDDASRLKIAWRYKDTPVQAKDQAPRKTISHSFDLSRPIAPELLVPNRIEVVQLPTENTTDPFKSLFETISKAIAKHNCDSNAESKEPRNVIRILLQSFGSPMWNSSAELAQQLQFLHALRGLLRNSFAVCYVTFPSHLFAAQHVRRVLHLCDSAVRLQSFQATHPPAFSKYHGLVHVTRLPRLNALTPPLQEATVYGFISKRRRFYIEQLHIPPADEGSSEPAASASAASLMCVPTKASKLEF